MKTNSKEPLVLGAQNFSAISLKKRINIPLVTKRIKNSDILLGVIVWGILISLCLLAVLWLNHDQTPVELVEESNLLPSYTLEEKQIDFFEKWQTAQSNKLAQKDWDAYIGKEE